MKTVNPLHDFRKHGGVNRLLRNKRIDVLIANSAAITLWASAFAGIRAGLVSYTPLHLAFLRLLIGSLGLAVFIVFRKIRLPDLRDVPVFLIMGFCGFTVYHTALNLGERTVSAGLSSLIVASAPIFTGILATLFLNERVTVRGWIGTLICFSGIGLISLATDGSFRFTGDTLWILLAAFSESVYFVIQSPYLKKYGIIASTTYTIWSGTLFMVFVSPGVLPAIRSASIGANLSVLYLGIFPTVIAYFALAYAVSRVGSAKGSASIYLTPVVAFLIAWIWLGETPDRFAVVGGVMILIGVTLVDKGVVEKRKQNVDEP